jgi:DNA-directed RNA polymerase specialized sigma24 family protein
MGAFEQLYRIHGARLKSIAYHTGGSRQDTGEVQETFLKSYHGIEGFAAGRASGPGSAGFISTPATIWFANASSRPSE